MRMLLLSFCECSLLFCLAFLSVLSILSVASSKELINMLFGGGTCPRSLFMWFISSYFFQLTLFYPWFPVHSLMNSRVEEIFKLVGSRGVWNCWQRWSQFYLEDLDVGSCVWNCWQRWSQFYLEHLDVGSWPTVGCVKWCTCHSVLAQLYFLCGLLPKKRFIQVQELH